MRPRSWVGPGSVQMPQPFFAVDHILHPHNGLPLSPGVLHPRPRERFHNMNAFTNLDDSQ
jgi:hypothetical protein